MCDITNTGVSPVFPAEEGRGKRKESTVHSSALLSHRRGAFCTRSSGAESSFLVKELVQKTNTFSPSQVKSNLRKDS